MTLETFFEQFELLADAPNGIQKLRELILQLAIQGKLVPQDPSDEPASVLLEKIKLQKEQLVKEKKVRQTEPLSSLKASDIPYQIPKAWQWVRFGDVTICRDGERIPISKDERATRHGNYDYYGASGVIDKIDGYLFDKSLLLIGEDGANLINRSTPIAFIASGKYWVNNHAHVLDGICLECLRYLEIFVNAIDLKPYITGTAQPKMNQAKMNSIPVPLPPLKEQRRIIARVEYLMALCDRLEEQQKKRRKSCIRLNEGAIAQLLTASNAEESDRHWQRICNNFDLFYSLPENISKLRQAILQLAVQGKLVARNPGDEKAAAVLERIQVEKKRLIYEGKISKYKSIGAVTTNDEPYPIPDEWLWVRFGDVLLDIEAGTSPQCEKHSRQLDEWGILKISAVSWDKFNPNENKALPKDIQPNPQYEVKQGDFLMSRANTSQLVGKSVVVEETPPCLLINDKTLRVSFPTCVDKFFYNLYNNSPVARSYYAQAGTGTSESMRNITREQIRCLPVPLPPLEEQKRIVAKVNRLMKLCDELEVKLKDSYSHQEKLMEVAAIQLMQAAAKTPALC